MKCRPAQFKRRYSLQLRRFLAGNAQLDSARRLATCARSAGIVIIEVARVHEQAMRTEVPSLCAIITPALLLGRANAFFAQVITPADSVPAPPLQAARLRKLMSTLDQRTIALAASHQQLKKETTRRTNIESALLESERHH